MTTFAQAVIQTPTVTHTLNGMPTFSTSTNSLVDFFFAVGSSRGKDITGLFESALQQDPQLALKILFWARDVRGGAGERQTFRNLALYLEKHHPQYLINLIGLIPFYGRWDDLLIFQTPDFQNAAFGTIANALVQGDSLAAKWSPRDGPVANSLRKFMNHTPKSYRQLLVRLSKTVETQMSSNLWDDINYDSVPSVASARYQKAYGRHSPEKYTAYKDGLKSGVNTINANAIFPHDVVKSVTNGDSAVADAQWNSLPNYMGSNNVLPMVDVSGSMFTPVSGAKNLDCIDVSIALGLYISSKQTGPFKDLFLTFSENPHIQKLSGTLTDRVNQLRKADWGANTNLYRAFGEILKLAVSNNIQESDMPEYLLILSDMEYDPSSVSYGDTAFQMISKQYSDANYRLPKIVFWNLKARAGNVPVKYDQRGSALVSGFSPSLMKSILACEDFTPENIMMAAINSPRYADVQIS